MLQHAAAIVAASFVFCYEPSKESTLMRTSIKNLLLLTALIAGFALTLPGRLEAQTYSNLYYFTNGTDGANPYAGLVLSGNTLYGTTHAGGSSTNGTVFKVNSDGTGFTNLHSFTATTAGTNSDGAAPFGGLILSGNTLYGTASQGGTSSFGTVFAISTNGAGFTNLHNFAGPPNDGASPDARLILSGNTLYGTASQGGTSIFGTVFAISTNGTGFTNLYNFTNGSDGSSPLVALIQSSGTLYGTALSGGSGGDGTVFAINTNGMGFTNLHSFTATTAGTNSDGAFPQSELILSGNTLYGTAGLGGAGGSGIVFALNTNGTGFTNLYSFTATNLDTGNNSDGSGPGGGLILSGNTLYGRSYGGGDWGDGTLFAINANGGSFTNLYNLADNGGGAGSQIGLVLSGNTFYGTTTYGGPDLDGTVFRLTLPNLGQSQFGYMINPGGTTITITSYTGPGGAVAIPATITGLPVTSIGYGAFYGNTNITSVTIGTNVISIGYGAFDSCYNLTSVTIPGNVTGIGDWAFEGTGLVSVTIANSVASIGLYAFDYCPSLTAITVDADNSNYCSINGVLFNKTQSILIQYPAGNAAGSYIVPGTVIGIGQDAFNSCSNLASITIGDGVASIGDGAFSDCSALTNVTLPNTVNSLGANAFIDCVSLASVTIPANITSIGPGTFSGCSSLANVVIPNNVTSIGDGAFSGCSSLTNLTIPNAVFTIGEAVFSDCANLTFVAIPDAVTSIGNGTFLDCASLTNVTMGSGVTSIGEYAFAYCSNLTGASIPNHVTNIAAYAFAFCTSLTNVTIGSDLTSIGDYAFAFCYNLAGAYFLGNAPSADDTVFYADPETFSIYYASGTSGWGPMFENVPAQMFNPPASNGSLQVFILPDAIAGLPGAPQWQVDGGLLQPGGAIVTGLALGNHIVSFTIVPGWTTPSSQNVSVNTNAVATATGVYVEEAPFELQWVTNFDNTITITSYTGIGGPMAIPSSINGLPVTAIGGFAFYGSMVTSVIIPNSVTDIGPWAFNGCTDLIALSLGNGLISIEEDAFYGCTSLTNVTIPDNVINIGSWAFSDCTNLMSVTIPNSVTSIGGWAFDGCSSLIALSLGNGLITIGDEAFEYCSSLTGVIIPNSVTSIGVYAFYYCASLTNLTIPNNVTNIGMGAFSECSGLTNVTISDSINALGDWVFEGCSALTTITIPNNITSIGSDAFSECTGLTNIMIPISVTVLGTNAFSGCSGLTDLTIPDNVTTIEDSAFAYCGSLTNVTVGSGVTRIGQYAFAYCWNLMKVYFQGNAVPVDVTLFDLDYNMLSVYYDPGTSGWGSFFGGVPAQMLNEPSPAGALQVTIHPAALANISGAPQWRVDGGVLQPGGATVTGLSVGNHTVSFTPVIGWTRPSNQNVTVAANSTATAVGIYTEQVQFEFSWVTNAGHTITITGYNGLGGAVSIPVSINNHDVTGIGSEAFYDATNLTSINIPGTVTSIGYEAFAGCANLALVSLPGGVTNLGDGAFSDCYSLIALTIPGGVQNIGENEFQFCSSLATVIIPAGVTNIGDFAFEYCGSLTNVTIPTNVQSIGTGAFAGDGLVMATIPASVTNLGGFAFGDCDSLMAINVDTNNSAYSATNGDLLDKSQAMLIQYPIGNPAESYIVPNTVTNIGPGAFYSCASLASVTISSNVISIGDMAFSECQSLTNVTLWSGVASIDYEAFSWCGSLTNLYFQGNAPAVDSSAFLGDSFATVYYLPGASGWGSTFAGLPAVMLNAPYPNGALQVFLLPPGANASGAQWQVDGGISQPSGATVLGLALGNHTVTVNSISNWLTPPGTNVTVLSNQTTVVTVAYIGTPPSIVVQPASPPPTQVGLFATFTVVASGSPPLSYQWTRSEVPLSNGGEFSGVNSPALTVDPVSQADAGTYSVLVSNAYGVTNSSNAVLSVLPVTNALEDFAAGTNFVASGNFTLANLSFSNALIFSQNDATNLFFYAASELLSLPEQPAGSNFLNRLGFGSAGRGLFNWQAAEPTNATGQLVIPNTTPPLNADEFTAQLRTNVLPAIILSQAEFAQITDHTFTVDLTTNETHAGAVTVDWGDVQMLRSFCDAAELFIYTTYSWNLNVQLMTASNFFGTNGTIEEFLTNYPSLLTTTTTADLPAAQTAFVNAINDYFAASQFIRSRPEGEIRLFNLSHNTNDLAHELRFRQTLSNLLSSLNGPVALSAHHPANLISMQAFFSGNFDLRSCLPEFDGDDFIWDTFPDTSFGGVITAMTQTQAGEDFRELGPKHHLQTVLDLPGTSLSVLYDFTEFACQTGVIQGQDGNFYGTLATGGPYSDVDVITGFGYGSVFKVTRDGRFTILYDFGTWQDDSGNPLDGAYPSSLVQGSDGNLYGVTVSGGTNGNFGTVFSITTDGQLTSLYSFHSEEAEYASAPIARLVQGADGLFYGTTVWGGAYDSGTLFSISPVGVFRLLSDLPSQSVEFNIDNYGTLSPYGYVPAAPLVQGLDGNFYGTTAYGGILTNVTSVSDSNGVLSYFTNLTSGYGTIFKVTREGGVSVLYTFGTQRDQNGDPLDGAVPHGLAQGADGNLYGVTQYGGANDDYIGSVGGIYAGYGPGDGTLFSISSSGVFSNLLSFDENFPDGYNPIGSLVPAPNGALFGIASAGGENQRGAVFVFNPVQGTASNIVWLTKSSGSYGANLQSFTALQSRIRTGVYMGPVFSPLSYGLDGSVYGTTTDGGTNGNGTIYRLALSGDFGVNVTLTPANGETFLAPANITLTATVNYPPTNTAVIFYNGTIALATNLAPPYIFTITNLTNQQVLALSALATNSYGFSLVSEVSYVTVNVPGTTWIDFDPLADYGPDVSGATLSTYLAQYGVTVTNLSPGTTVSAENQTNVAGGGFVLASSQPNILTQAGSSGPVSFTVGFSPLLSSFTFTRPELLANPSVSHPAWEVGVFDPLGNLLETAQELFIYSTTNVPASTFTLSGGSIASAEFSSEGTGLATFNAMLLDDFILVAGNATNLPPSILITSPTNGQIFAASAEVPISVETSPGMGTVTSVDFYVDGALAGLSQASPFSFNWQNPLNGSHVLTAVVSNSFGLTNTSAPVAVTTGFAIITPPVSQTIALGGNAAFSVTTTGSGVSYQWELNGAPIFGATLPSFSVSNAPVGDAGTYTVLATNNMGQSASASAVLTVVSPPTLGPISITTNNVTNIILSVTASDSIAFYSQWRLNGNGIPGATNTYAAGSNTPISYTITNAQPFDSGSYQVVVANYAASVQSPVFPVALTYGTPISTNDIFASRLTLSTNATYPVFPGVAGDNSSSPAAGELAAIAGKPAGNFLWYSWQAGFTGIISLTTRGSSFDTLLGVYTGAASTNLTSVAEDDDSGGFFTSLVSFNCVQGVTYQIAVAGYQGASGSVALALSPGPPLLPGPTNGYFLSSIPQPVITRQPVNQIVHLGATVTVSVTANNAAGYQWYFANVPVAGGNASTLAISNFPPGAVGNYFVQATNAVGVVQSQTVAIELQTNTTSGQTNLAVDKFGDAVDLTGAATPEHYRPADGGGETGGYTLSQSFSTVGATKEEGEPSTAGQPGGASYWYSYAARTNGTLIFDTAGSTFNTMLAVYTGPGTGFSTLTSVGAAFTTNYIEDGQPEVVISNAIAGTRYYISIDGYQGASGSAYLNVVLNPPTNGLLVTNGPHRFTNNTPVVAIKSPANNHLTTDSNINVLVTVKDFGYPAPPVGVAVNTNAFGAFTATNLQKSNATVEVWSTNVTLVPGPNLITAQTFATEGTNTNNIFLSVPATCTVFYATNAPSAAHKAHLTLQISPPSAGKITGQANKAYLEINKVFTINAVPRAAWAFTNWTMICGTNTNCPGSLPALSFLMCSNLTLQANFVSNPFPPFAGAYDGLFSPTNGMTEASSGFFTATILSSSRGAYSAKLLLDGGSYSFSGAFNLDMQAAAIIARSNKPPLTVELQLTNDQIIGTVNDNATNAWFSQLLANRSLFNARTYRATNYEGIYTLVLLPGGPVPANEPIGCGYATLSNSAAGLVSLSGRLADNTAISQSVPVATNGDIPLYVSLYKHQGSLQGWLTLTNLTNGQAQTIVGAGLGWIKPGTSLAGFTNTNLSALGSFYEPPKKGVNNWDLTNCTLTLSNTAGEVLIYSNVAIAGNKLQTNSPEPTNLLKGALNPGTGVLTLAFRPTGTNRNTVATGVVLPEDSPTNAAGWFLEGGQSGFFLLQP
jgi:uncharacterized repeat protein (TIGR03803 family)